MNQQTSSSAQVQRQQLRTRLEQLANLLDTAWRIPGTRVRFGVDGLIGLVPVAGDLAGMAMGLWMIWQARSVKAPLRLQIKMLLNLGIEAVIGIVPLIGDAFDVLWQANQRNRRVLLKWMDKQDRTDAPKSRRGWMVWLAAAAVLAGVVWWIQAS